MSNIQFDSPTAPPPSTSSECPWAFRVQHKSDTVAASFADMATPEQAKACISYYDKNRAEGDRVVKLSKFTAIVVATLSGVNGTTKVGDTYINYYSSLVQDTRTDRMNVWMSGLDRPVFAGLYADIKPSLPQGVSYHQALICFVPELDRLVALNLSFGLQMHLKHAIANAAGGKPEKINLFSLCELATQYWAFKFDGTFEKKNKNGEPWASGEMRFQPKATAVVINQKPETQGWFDKLDALRNDVNEYLDFSQKKANEYRANQNAPQTQEPSAPAPQRMDSYNEPVNRNVTPNQSAVSAGFDTNFPTEPPSAIDDLPF